MTSMHIRGARALAALVTGLAVMAAGPREARALDLDAAFREVAAANPTLAGRRDMAEAARQRVTSAGAWPSPMLEVGAINVPTNGSFDMDPMTMKMVGIEQRLPLFGARGLRRNAASAAADAEDAGVEMANYETFALAWEAYADAYHADQLIAQGHAHHAEMDQLVRSARARYDAGRGRLDEVLRAEAEHARTSSDMLGFRAEAVGARARLAALMGRPTATLDDALEPLPATTLPEDPALVAAAVSDAHPQLRAGRARAEGYRLAAQAARRMTWPDLTVGFSYGFREPIMGMPQDDMWTATVGFMLPIFAGQNEGAMGAEMDAMARASDSELRAASLELDRQARSLHALARADRGTITLLADSVVTTERRAVAAAWSAYTAGATDLGRVFEATHDLYREEVSLVRARQDLARVEARLLAITARPDLFSLTLPAIPRREP